MPESVITFENVSYRYEDAGETSIKDVNLTIMRGEFVLLMGPSGSGKSTLCQMINGVIPHVVPGKLKGKVIVDRYDTTRTSPATLSKRVGMVFQDPEIQLFSLVVEDEVAMSLENLAVPEDEMQERVDWALKATGLEELRFASTTELSGGQKQRLATAAALSSGADIIILDEPTAYLDNEGTQSILKIIRELSRNQGKTVILVEHKIERTLQFADRLIIMDGGTVVNDGSPRSVLSKAKELKGLGIRLPVALELALELGVETSNPPLTLEELKRTAPIDALARVTSEKVARPRKVRTDSQPAVRIERVTFAYPNGTYGVRDLDLTIERGEYVSILGRNGAGKSTLAGLITGLLKPTAGKVVIHGVDTRSATVAEMARRVGYLMQNPDHQLFSDTLEDELSFGPRNVGVPPQKVKEMISSSLNLIGLSGFEGRSPYDLSVGQRLRVALAATLILSPSVLLLDEPTIGQDYAHLIPMMNQVSDLNKLQGKTVIIITHDSHLASLYAGRTVLLRNGRIAADGPTLEILADEETTHSCGVDPAPLPRLLSEVQSIRSKMG